MRRGQEAEASDPEADGSEGEAPEAEMEEPEPDGLPVTDPHEASVLVFPEKRVLFRPVL